jgi:predicted TIM-barrel enzyme
VTGAEQYIRELGWTEALPTEQGFSESEVGLIARIKSMVGQVTTMNNVRRL